MFDRNTMIKELVRDEGRVLHVYPDSESYLSIGVGRCIDKRAGGSISLEEAAILLNNDISGVLEGLMEKLPWFEKLDPVRQRVLVNMAFNLGVGGLLRFRETLEAIRREQYSLASIYMLDSKWAHQVGKRANRLSDMMKSGRIDGA